MSKTDQAMAALEDTDWSGAEVVREPRPASTVFSVRLPDGVSQAFEAIATEREVTPTKLLRELVDAAIAGHSEGQVVTLRVEDLHKAIDAMVVQAQTREAA